jgi:hypothetical protein
MDSGGAEVIKIPVMIFTFLAVMAFIISSLGPVGGNITRDIPGYISGNLYYEATEMSGTQYTYDTTNVSAAVGNDWAPYVDDPLAFYRADVTFWVYVHIIRDSIDYDPNSSDPMKMYNDFISVNTGDPYTLYVHPQGPEQYVISFADIEATYDSTDNNITKHSFPLLDWWENTVRSLTLQIEVPIAPAPADYHDSLYANYFYVSLYERDVSNELGFFDVLAMFFTFNADWIPTYAIVAYLMSAIMWLALILTVIRILW